jgi:hypothetical protein
MTERIYAASRRLKASAARVRRCVPIDNLSAPPQHTRGRSPRNG